MAGRFEGLSDEMWFVLEKILPPPPQKRGKGMPHAPFRCVLNSIFYVLITGCRWCDLPNDPQIFAHRSSSHRWLTRWSEDGTFDQLCDSMRALADLNGQIDWSRASVDGSFSLRKRRG